MNPRGAIDQGLSYEKRPIKCVLLTAEKQRHIWDPKSKRESNSTFRDAGVTAMLGSMIEMGGRGDGRGVVRGS